MVESMGMKDIFGDCERCGKPIALTPVHTIVSKKHYHLGCAPNANDGEFRLRKRPSAYLQGRRDAFEVAASILRDSRDIANGLGPLIATMGMYANAAIATMNRETDMRLKNERELCRVCGGDGSVKIPGGIRVCPACDGDCWEPEVATRALSFDEMLNRIAPILDGTPNAHARAEKIITALFGEPA